MTTHHSIRSGSIAQGSGVTLRTGARSGAGWTVLPDSLCAEDLARGHLTALPTSGADPENTLYLAWNKAALLHPRVVHAGISS